VGYTRTTQDRPHRVPLAYRSLHRPKAEFLFVPPDDVARVARESDAIPFDVEGVEKHGFVIYDALYAWLREARSERHTWNPQRVTPTPETSEAR
jgi:hypothetical protein